MKNKTKTSRYENTMEAFKRQRAGLSLSVEQQKLIKAVEDEGRAEMAAEARCS